MSGNRSALDRIAMQIQWDRLLAVVEEQAQALVRTAFSPAARGVGRHFRRLFRPSGGGCWPRRSRARPGT